MHILKKVGIGVLLSLALASCSSDKNEEKPAASLMEKISKPKSSVADEMLSHVPADTAYLLGNSQRIPDDVADVYITRGKAVWSNMASVFEQMQTQQSERAAEEPAPDFSFFNALMAEMAENPSVESFRKNGMKANAHSVVYGLDLMPVARVEIADKKAFREMLTRVEEKSGHKLAWTSCDGLDCVQFGDENLKGVFAVSDQQMMIAAYEPTRAEQVFAHLSGNSKPENAYTPKAFADFLAENEFQGYGDGFLKFDALLDSLEKLIKEQMKKEQGAQAFAASEVEFDKCFAIARKHADHVKELVVGTREFSKDRMSYQMVVKTAPEISAVLKGLANSDLGGFKTTENPIVHFGMNLNFLKVRDGLAQYINYLAKTGEETQCSEIKPEEMRKAIGGISMAMAMGLGQFKAVTLSVDKVEMDEQGQPTKLEAMGSIMADDPVGLLQMLAMVNPMFASLQVPADGSVLTLPEGLIPPNPVVQNVGLSRGEKTLNVMVGNDQPALKDVNLKPSTFMWGSTDNKRYYELYGKFLKSAPQGKNVADQQAMDSVVNMMTAAGDMAGTVSQQMGADDRGLVIDYQIHYQ